jgi:hypothetical protein
MNNECLYIKESFSTFSKLDINKKYSRTFLHVWFVNYVKTHKLVKMYNHKETPNKTFPLIEVNRELAELRKSPTLTIDLTGELYGIYSFYSTMVNGVIDKNRTHKEIERCKHAVAKEVITNVDVTNLD